MLLSEYEIVIPFIFLAPKKQDRQASQKGNSNGLTDQLIWALQQNIQI